MDGEATQSERGKRRPVRLIAAGAAALVLAAAGAVLAFRLELLPADRLPASVARLVAPEPAVRPAPEAGTVRPPVTPDPPAAPVPPRDRLQDLDPDLRNRLLDRASAPRFGFAAQPAVAPPVLCDLMNAGDLGGAVWAPDPVLPGDWTCYTDLLQVGGGIDTDPSTVFGFIRGRHRARTDLIRLTVAFGDAADRARSIAADTLDALLEKARIAAPAGFLEAVAAGESSAAWAGGLRFEVIRGADAPRMDVVITVAADAGLVPSLAFSGRGPRLPGDPPENFAPAPAAPPPEPVDEQPAPALELPEGFEVVSPEDEPPAMELEPEDLAEEPPAEESAGEEAPIDNPAR